MLLIALLVLEQKQVLVVALGLTSEQENILFLFLLPSCRCCPDAQRLKPAALMQLNIPGVESH